MSKIIVCACRCSIVFALLVAALPLAAAQQPLAAKATALRYNPATEVTVKSVAEDVAPQAGSEPVALRPRPPKHPKLSSHLADLSRAVPQQRGAIPQGQRITPPPGFSIDAMPKSVRDAVRAGIMRINKDGEVQVYILVSEVNDENLNQLRAAGATVELENKQQRIVQARVPVTRLEEVAALPFVRFARLPDYRVHQTGSVDTQGDSVLKADQVRSLLGVDGSGVRVGVISSGIAGVFATGCTTCGPTAASPSPISSGDLPSATGTRNASGILTSVSGGIVAKSFRADGDLEGTPPLGCAFPAAGAEGTAMLEIVHDLAPGSPLLFANGDTSLEFQQAVNFLAATADGVVDDISFVAKPYDGTSDVSTNTANALNNNANPIRAYFTSVGNFARFHYQGSFVDSGVDGTAIVGLPGHLHLFQATADTSDVLGLGSRTSDVIRLPTGATVVIFLVWNDPFGASSNDYDLFLIQNSTGLVVARSIDPQSGTQDPVEALIFTNNTGVDDFFLIIIQNSANRAAVRTLDMFLFQPECASKGPLALALTGENHNYNTVRSSVPAQADAGGSPVSVISVGAANWMTTDTIENFSSNGPTNDGRLKPDVIAVDGVSITGAGGFGNSPPRTFPQTFFGTSAASPHAAGVGALVLQSSPCLLAGSTSARTPVDARTILRNLLTSTAVDLGAAGPDNVFGFGRLDALAAASKTIPTANAGSNQTLNGTSPSGATVALSGTASSDPNSCPLTLTWSGGCGSATGTNPTVTCPPGVNTMNLTVSNNGVTRSAPSSVQIVVTDFTVGASPGSAMVKAGQAATYTVNLGSQFGPFTNPVSLSCSNLPGLSSCAFSPATATPGTNGATSTLTISTTAASALLRPPFDWPRSKPLYVMSVFLLGLAAITMLLSLKKPRQKLSPRLLLGTVAAFLLLQLACGGGGGGGGSSRPGTPSGTFVFTVTGTSGSLQHSSTATLIVQ